jgi:hypothetical protein
MTYNLFIDDERDPFHVTWGNDQVHYKNGDWIIARNWYDVLEIIVSLGFPNMISFDHDLGEDTKSGYEIAKNICDLVMDANYELPEDFQYFVHSKNPVGKQNIEMFMNNFLNHMKG